MRKFYNFLMFFDNFKNCCRIFLVKELKIDYYKTNFVRKKVKIIKHQCGFFGKFEVEAFPISISKKVENDR